jgi:hypothetical protein
MINQFYPLADHMTGADWEKLGLNNLSLDERRKKSSLLKSLGSYSGDIRAISTGEKRMPKKGEWYLSGAVVEAYRAPNDLNTEFHIAKLVNTKTETTVVTTIIS